MTARFSLKATARTKIGSSDSRRVRKDNQTPCVIYNQGGKNHNITVDSKELEYEYLKGNLFTTIVDIELNGKTITALATKIDFHPVDEKPIHVDFIPFKEGEEVRAKTKVSFTNKDKSPGIKRGGFLHIVNRKVEVVCKSDIIPAFVEIDLAPLFVGSKITSDAIKLPEGVSLFKKGPFVVASIIGRGSKDAAETGSEDSSEEAEEEKK
jgi:large subunit ribosomal protein L25